MTPDRLLHVALQEGFDGVSVVVLVDGEEVYRRPDVQTDPRISLADSFEVPMPEPPVVLEVRLPDIGARGSFTVDREETPYVAVSYLDGSLEFRASATPFGYL